MPKQRKRSGITRTKKEQSLTNTETTSVECEIGYSPKRQKTNNTNNVFNCLNDNVQENEIMQSQVNISAKPKDDDKVTRPPPITFKNIDITKMRKMLSATPEVDMNALTMRITEHGIKVQLADEQQHEILVKKCKNEVNIHFFTHTKKQERQVKFCLYGLWIMDKLELEEELKNNGISARNIEEMPIHKRRYSDQCIYKLTFLNGDNMNVTKLRQIRFLFHCSVRWQYFKGKSFSTTRCTNCQEWGHGEKNCYSVTKCCRCAENHKSSKCPHIIENENKIPVNLVKCANCGEKHTAGFSGCSAKLKYETVQKRMRENARISSKNRYDRPPNNDNRNFPHSFEDAPIPQHNYWNDRQNQSSQRQRPSNENLMNEQECLNVMEQLLIELPKCQTRTQQFRAMSTIAIRYVYGGRP